MKTQKHLSLYRIITVFVAGLFLMVLTACGTPKVIAKDTSSSTANKPADVAQPSDLQQRQDLSGTDKKAESLITGAKANLEKHGNYQGSNNPLESERSISERAADVRAKAGEGVETLKENLQNSAEDAKNAATGAARSAKAAADNVSNKAQRTGYDLRSRTFDND